MHHTRIKICGITREDDLHSVVAAGADAVGFVFHAASPRNLVMEQARVLAARTPAFVTRVALFMDAEAAFIEEVLGAVNLDLLQFHGQETPAECIRWGVDYIKAIPMGGIGPDAGRIADYLEGHDRAKGFLLDSNVIGQAGGSGKTFDWSRVGALFEDENRIILAGGLTPENAAEAVRQVRPFAVDVSSGVEAAKGVKDPAKVLRFAEAVRRADIELNTQSTSNPTRSKGAAA
ncbi:MAG: phosphoribosylanthranilate isomerase [Gammaproteobacteria bacterium]